MNLPTSLLIRSNYLTMKHRFMNHTSALFAVCLLLLNSCARTSPKIDASAYAKEIAQWQAQRLADLKSEYGWLTLVGLVCLKEGDYKIGIDKSNDIALSPDEICSQ